MIWFTIVSVASAFAGLAISVWASWPTDYPEL